MAQLVKNPPAMQETWVRSLGWEDPLEKRKSTHSRILAWRIPCYGPWGCKESEKYFFSNFYFLPSSDFVCSAFFFLNVLRWKVKLLIWCLYLCSFVCFFLQFCCCCFYLVYYGVLSDARKFKIISCSWWIGYFLSLITFTISNNILCFNV